MTSNGDDAIARVNATIAMQDFAYIKDQWGDLYDIANDNEKWLAVSKRSGDILTADSADDLQRRIWRHYPETKHASTEHK